MSMRTDAAYLAVFGVGALFGMVIAWVVMEFWYNLEVCIR